MGPDGKKKLSKRDGAKDVLDYIRDGYLPETLVSFIATMGWNDGTEQEIFTQDQLVKSFSLDRVQRSGARFDEQRLLWMNGTYIRQLPLDDLYTRVAEYWPTESKKYPDAYKKQVLGLVQERLKFFKELPELTQFFFTDLPVNSNLWTSHKQLKKLSNEEVQALLVAAKQVLEKSDFTVADLTEELNMLLETTGQKPAILFSIIRIATTQAPASPALAETLAVLGKERSLQRINSMLHSL
jgi:glutamyl-tRNA synthetase